MAAADVEYRCFVGGLAWATNNESLEHAFASYGEILDSKVCLLRSHWVSFRGRSVLLCGLDPCRGSVDLLCFGPDLRSLEPNIPSDAVMRFCRSSPTGRRGGPAGSASSPSPLSSPCSTPSRT